MVFGTGKNLIPPVGRRTHPPAVGFALPVGFPLLFAAETAVAGLGEPVTPALREAWALHGEFMALVSVLFAAAFAVMLRAMARSRKPAGTGGLLEWFWALVPFGILLGINLVLMAAPPARSPAAAGDAPSPAGPLPAPASAQSPG